ncbi:hypothetical protein C8C83_4167 [Flavobacterium sp. 90]|uniref:hypothetical protein n=1 Tax=unclassified Flavobacterium TaxID=196869 RepID=UPI0010458842|nr:MULTISPECIES: hypothetical protein [unclassified Flavobacterium]TCK56155.1 hypothetical protein C8C83_4167 [Flavobacterium sp. 90]
MNENLINRYQINFVNSTEQLNNYQTKITKQPNTKNNYLNLFLYEWSNPQEINENLLPDIETALLDRNYQESNSSENVSIMIYHNRVELYDDTKIVYELPTEDFKEIVIGWRDFLLTPPLNGTKVYQDNQVERSENRQEINSTESSTVFETTESEISDIELKTYSKQNKFVFILSLVLFITSFLFFFIIVPSLDVARIIIPVSIVGSIMISLSGFYCLLYYKSWKKDFIEKVGKPKLNIETFVLICSLPTALFYFIISWNFLEGPGHNLYKLGITLKVLKFLNP